MIDLFCKGSTQIKGRFVSSIFVFNSLNEKVFRF